MARKAKERVIYDNYSLSDNYPDDCIKEKLVDDGQYDNEDDVSDEAIWKERYCQDEIDWDNARYELDEYFKTCNKLIAFGSCGLWHGSYAGGFIFNTFDELIKKIGKDCDYFKFYDENGHLYMQCSHHDGTHSIEIKELTDKGIDYLNNWEYNWDDKRTEQYVHTQIIKKYSKIPRFAEKVYGCKAREYEKAA